MARKRKLKTEIMNTENNKLIAEFMGRVIPEDELEFYDENPTTHYYDSDWNWLMEVVEKIESLKPFEFLSGRSWIGFDVRIYKTFNTQTNYCTIKYLKESGDMTISNGFSKNNKIEAVYNACVEFIKWYNENKI